MGVTVRAVADVVRPVLPTAAARLAMQLSALQRGLCHMDEGTQYFVI
jgi:hypothetical protein